MRKFLPESIPNRRFWSSCFSAMVKMTRRFLTTVPTDSLSNGRDNEEYDNLVQYVRTFIETERARKVSSSLETLGEDAKIWSLLFKRVSLFTLSSSSVSTDNEAKSQSSSVKLLQFFVCFASALVRDEKHKLLGAVADDVGYHLSKALPSRTTTTRRHAETIALFSSVLSALHFWHHTSERRKTALCYGSVARSILVYTNRSAQGSAQSLNFSSHKIAWLAFGLVTPFLFFCRSPKKSKKNKKNKNISRLCHKNTRALETLVFPTRFERKAQSERIVACASRPNIFLDQAPCSVLAAPTPFCGVLLFPRKL